MYTAMKLIVERKKAFELLISARVIVSQSTDMRLSIHQ